MKTRPRSIDTARPVHNNPALSTGRFNDNMIYQEKEEKEKECATVTCGAEYDL
jgi:hypothetical protein